VCLFWILSNKLDLNQETRFTIFVYIAHMIFSFLNDKYHLAPKYYRASSLEVLRPFTFLIWFSNRMLPPLYSRSGSLIGSAYSFLYVSFCFRFNKTLTNLTLLCQHHLQYTGGLAETQGLLLPSWYCHTHPPYSSDSYRQFSSFQNFIRDYCSYLNNRSCQNVLLTPVTLKLCHGRSCSKPNAATTSTRATCRCTEWQVTAATTASAATATTAGHSSKPTRQQCAHRAGTSHPRCRWRHGH